MKPAAATAAVAIIESLAPSRSVLILRRAPHPNDPWSGHFSFPGGRRDKGDPDILATCLRETEEETGIILEPGQLQQALDLEAAGGLLNTPLWVQPFVFTLPEKPDLAVDPREIETGYWLKASEFEDPGRHGQQELLPDQLFPAFALGDYYLWGFTYRLLQHIIPLSRQ